MPVYFLLLSVSAMTLLLWPVKVQVTGCTVVCSISNVLEDIGGVHRYAIQHSWRNRRNPLLCSRDGHRLMCLLMLKRINPVHIQHSAHSTFHIPQAICVWCSNANNAVLSATKGSALAR